MITLNGYPILSLELIESKQGNWICDVEAKVPEEESVDSVTIDFEGATYSGAVFRGGQEAGRYRARVVGGKGGLTKDVEARFYGSTTAGQVLNDLATDSGEKLSNLIGPEVKSFSLSRWLRPVGNGRKALGDLATALGMTWRVLRDGTLWIGTDRYEPVTPEDFGARILSPDALHGSVESAPDWPGVRPGVLFLDRKVANVVTTVREGRLRQIVYFEDESRPLGKLGAILSRLVESIVGRRIDYAQSYPCSVVKQSGDLLDVVPDNPKIKGDGLTKLPIRHGVPGMRVEVTKGARCRVRFDNGNPSEPYVALWDFAAGDVTLIEIGQNADYVALAGLVADQFDQVNQDITDLKNQTYTAINAVGAGTAANGPAAATSFQSATAAIPSTPGDVASSIFKTA